MEQYLDQRILNTKQCFYAALFSLIKTESYISVLDVCRKAKRSNITFYHHYSNINDLMEEAIKDQLFLRMPIPTKLKPRNLKQLIYYLFNFLLEFSLNNKDLISGVSSYIDKHGYKNSYLDLLTKILETYINNELRQLCCDLDPITINMWSETLTTGLLKLFFNRVIVNKVINFETVKNSFNLFINRCLISN